MGLRVHTLCAMAYIMVLTSKITKDDCTLCRAWCTNIGSAAMLSRAGRARDVENAHAGVQLRRALQPCLGTCTTVTLWPAASSSMASMSAASVLRRGTGRTCALPNHSSRRLRTKKTAGCTLCGPPSRQSPRALPKLGYAGCARWPAGPRRRGGHCGRHPTRCAGRGRWHCP